MNTKQLIVVGGPNGAGKSTFVHTFLLEHPCPYLSADLIATRLSIKESLSLQFAAGQEFLNRFEAHLLAGDDFIVETTFSGRTWKNYLLRARDLGFEITGILHLFGFTGQLRRTCQGARPPWWSRCPKAGYSSPVFSKPCEFLEDLSKIVDHWAIVYNAGGIPVEVAFGYREEFGVSDEPLFARFLAFAEAENNG